MNNGCISQFALSNIHPLTMECDNTVFVDKSVD